MASPSVRRRIQALAAVVALACLAVAVIPYLASTRIVRDGIAVELSAWSGYRVDIAESPEIDIWPRLRANLRNVTLSQWDGPAEQAVAHIERIEVELSALAALRGKAVFSSALLVRPRIVVEEDDDGSYRLSLPSGGRIADSIKATRAAVGQDGSLAEGYVVPTDAFGRVEFVDGLVEASGPSGREDIATELAGSIDWPALNQTGLLLVRGRWRDEAATLDLEAASPLILLAGGQTSVHAVVKAVAATGSFEGTLKLSDPYFDGQVSLSAPSYEDLAAWTRSELAADGAIRSASLSSSIVGDLRKIKFGDLDVEIDGHRGSGAIDVSFEKGHPAIAGSLAFQTFDMAAMLEAVSPLAARDEDAGDPSAQYEPLDLDLRLSALRASVGKVEMTDVAATAQVRNGFAAFDISDAASFGGSLQASIRLDRKPQGPVYEFRLLATDVDGGAFGSSAGMTRLVPIGRGTVSLILKGPGAGLREMLVHASGSMSATFGQGALSHFDLAEFLKRSRAGGFFSLDDVSAGTLSVDSVAIRATIADGVARIDNAEAVTGGRRLRISGIVPYVGRGLALTGTIEPTAGAAAPSERSDFFVGGSWSAPFVSPVVAHEPIE